ncbi:MAG: hypothetical protein AB7G28_16975 [Pirellulales bacterium]
MKRNLLPLMFLAAFALLAIAIAVDCVRIAGDYRERVSLADAEVAKQETRLAKLLEASPQVTPEVTAAIASYRGAKDVAERHEAFDALESSFQLTMAGKLDATNPLDRKFMDDATGAINRRQVAEKPFETEEAAYQAYLASWRGQIAQWFSPTARADAKSFTP